MLVPLSNINLEASSHVIGISPKVIELLSVIPPIPYASLSTSSRFASPNNVFSSFANTGPKFCAKTYIGVDLSEDKIGNHCGLPKPLPDAYRSALVCSTYLLELAADPLLFPSGS